MTAAFLAVLALVVLAGVVFVLWARGERDRSDLLRLGWDLGPNARLVRLRPRRQRRERWHGARGRSHRRNVLYVYRHVDEILGAKKAEQERAAKARDTIRFWTSLPFLQPIGRVWIVTRWRTPNDTVRWPPHRRRARYVELRYGVMVRGTLQPPPPVGALHLWQIHAVMLTWSTEAVANHDCFEEACERGRAGIGVGAGAAGLAQALGIQWRDGVFERARDDARHRITFIRTYAADVPADFDVLEDSNGDL